MAPGRTGNPIKSESQPPTCLGPLSNEFSGTMVQTSEPVLRRRFCRDRRCGREFHICRSCDRGQRYCSEECQHRCRREQCRAANRLHQESPEGRLDHRDHQRAYLERLKRRVTDQGRDLTTGSVKVAVVVAGISFEDVSSREIAFEFPPQCRLCGRRSRWLEIEGW